jgi:hypothetical protein
MCFENNDHLNLFLPIISINSMFSQIIVKSSFGQLQKYAPSHPSHPYSPRLPSTPALQQSVITIRYPSYLPVAP